MLLILGLPALALRFIFSRIVRFLSMLDSGPTSEISLNTIFSVSTSIELSLLSSQGNPKSSNIIFTISAISTSSS